MSNKKSKTAKINKELFSNSEIERNLFLINLNKTKGRIIEKCKKRFIENNVFEINGIGIKNANYKLIFDEYERVFEINPIVFYFNEIYHKRNKINQEIEISKKDNESYIYFFINEKYRFCKIGYSINPSERLKSVQTGCPFELTIAGIIKGDFYKEKSFYEMFSKCRTYGEWFKISGSLRDFILDKFY